MPDPRDTPAMRQFTRYKRAYPDCILLFRIGDFYETFDDDAVAISKALGLTLTKRSEGIPMAGVPHHQVETYLRRLIEQGFRVAVCDQVQDAAEAKAQGGIIERAVTRVLSPGTLVDETLLDDGSPGALAALAILGSGPAQRLGLAVVEASTGKFSVVEVRLDEVLDELTRRGVTEVIYSDQAAGLVAGASVPAVLATAVSALGIATTARPNWQFRQTEAIEILRKQFAVASLGGFGLQDDEPASIAAGAIVRYLLETQAPQATESEGDSKPKSERFQKRTVLLRHLQPPRRDAKSEFCTLDAVSLRALEVEGTLRGGGPAMRGRRGATPGGDGSLLDIFMGPGGCRTAMGKRLLREWLCRPLLDLQAIRQRHACVAALATDRRMSEELTTSLGLVQDVARIAGRIALGRPTPRDLVALGSSIAALGSIHGIIQGINAFSGSSAQLAKLQTVLEPVCKRILAACVDAPPPHLREGGLVRDGVDAELDEARVLQRDAASWLAKYQEALITEHNLPSIKVGYNKFFGYFIELPQAQAKRAPDVFTRKQTLKNAERYITPELKAFEEKVNTAEARALDRERAIFDALCAAAFEILDPIAQFGETVAELDVLACFADRALRRGWVMPEMTDQPVLVIREGRHPVLELLLGDRFVPNDLSLGAATSSGGAAMSPEAADANTASRDDGPTISEASSSASLALITGPNMAGKSTFIRQTALIVLLAQAGSFVPARAATIGLCDRIFTRVGADDALYAGQSTFMVEMTETANILHHATQRSLVILDEIGRGTSTLDGLSLAWAIAESLAHPDPAEANSAAVSLGSQAGGVSDSLPNRRRSSATSAADAPPLGGPRTLFATHYHELTHLEERMPGRVKNLRVLVREWPPGDPNAQLVFLHRIEQGRADRSYGVHVARLAGVPATVVARAQRVLDSLVVHHEHDLVEAGDGLSAENGAGESSKRRLTAAAKPVPESAFPRETQSGQLGLFVEYVSHPVVDAIREIKIDALTPLAAFDALRQLKGIADGRASSSPRV